MIIDTQMVEKARAIADSADLSPAMLAVVAAFRHQLAKGSDRAAFIHARAVVRRAEREGLTVAASSGATVKELREEIAKRNEGRDEADLIRPAGTKKADLEQALAADDDR